MAESTTPDPHKYKVADWELKQTKAKRLRWRRKLHYLSVSVFVLGLVIALVFLYGILWSLQIKPSEMVGAGMFAGMIGGQILLSSLGIGIVFCDAT